MSVETEIGEPFAEQTEPAVCVRPPFPLRPGKVQRPLLPEETLRRDRLLEWLDSRGRRVTAIVAEAGFGKTTLIADHVRRAGLRTFWYRLDEDDTDGLVFMRYLVAACQAVDPHLLRRPASLLNETAIEPIRQDVVVDALLMDLDGLGEVPSALVLDDFQVVESNASIMPVVEKVLARGPEQLKIFLVGRRMPRLPLAGLRSRGELAVLRREELRFDAGETERLFRDSYRQPLEADVLRDLQDRTEGWAASLRLVGTALDGRTPAQIRAFVRSLTGSEGHLYDYLAEEVIGDLDDGLRQFLTRVSLLEEMDVRSASVAAEVGAAEARLLLTRAESLGLVSKSEGDAPAWRAHPLVREFLGSRLEADLGAEGIKAMHRRLAAAFESESWRLAARHWAAAGEDAEVRRVLCGAIAAIIGTGDLATAEDLMTRFPDPGNPYYAILHSRTLAAESRIPEAFEAARPVFDMSDQELATDPQLTLMCALSKLQLGFNSQDALLRNAALATLRDCGDPELAAVAVATERLADSAESGSLDLLREALVETACLSRQAHHSRHEGISYVNLTFCEFSQAQHLAALHAGESAIRLVTPAGATGDVIAAHANLARSLAHIGRISEWRSHADFVMSQMDRVQAVTDLEPGLEIAELELMYGDPVRGRQIYRSIAERGIMTGDPFLHLVQARIAMLEGAHSADEIGTTAWFAFTASRSAAMALRIQQLACLGKWDPIEESIRSALAFSASQQAWFWWRAIRTTQALIGSSQELTEYIHCLECQDSGYLSMQAELVTRRLGEFDQKAFDIVRAEAVLRPERWRWALCKLFQDPKAGPGDIKRAVELMELVGSVEDLALLRSLARKKSLKVPDAGRALAKRLAPRAYVEDLGRVSLRIGERVVQGTEIRKKVLALLVFLLTRPQFTATREQVIEALWPDLEPEGGANSLNQTAYFLRQVFEPKADDDLSAGYLNCRADLMWLDSDLVRSRSSECLDLIASTRRTRPPDLVMQLAESYTGRFAVDFIYEDWASAFRDSLHASYLDRVERSVAADTKAGFFDRAISVAQMALAADPEAEQIELQLLRLYRLTGAHAAAAEQYAHYAAVLREQLGVEPPPLDSI